MQQRFFFDDAQKVAAYVKEHCPDETAHAIEVADNKAGHVILFNMPYDMEQSHEPVVFGEDIDWLHQPGDDPEWTFALNRMCAWICMGQAYAVTGDEKYPQMFARQLLHWTRTVRRDDPKAANAWRTIEVGFRLEVWPKAYQYMKDSPAVTQAVRDAYYKSLSEQAEFIMTVWNEFNLMSNWGILANRGLFVTACAMPESSERDGYIRTSIDRLAKAVEIQVYADGFHWEQSPMYHNEVLRCLLDVVLLAKRCNTPLPLVIHKQTHAMLHAALLSAKPDGNHLMMGDSDDVSQREVLAIGAYLYNDGQLKFGAGDKFGYDTAWMLGCDAMAEYDKITPIRPENTAHAMYDSGNFFSRSDWTPDAFFIHFHCGTLGAGHGHADKLHMDLFAGGEDILIDPGRYTYVSGADRYWYKAPQAHNTLTVEGTDIYVCKDSWESEKLTRAVGQKFIEQGNYVYMEGAHLGYMELGVYVSRRIIHIKPDIVLICDTFHGKTGEAHTCNQFFHWNNNGEVTGNGTIWNYRSSKNHARLVLCSSSLIETQLQKGRISRHYNEQEDSVVLKTGIEVNGFAGVFTVITVDKAGKESAFEVKKETVHSNFKHIVFPDDTVEALTITKEERRYTVVLAHKEYACPTDTFTAAGCIGFGHAVVFDRSNSEPQGTVLLH